MLVYTNIIMCTFSNISSQYHCVIDFCVMHNQSKVKVKWHTSKYGDPYSELVLCIYPILNAHTQQWTHTHHEHTPRAVGSHLCCGTRGAVEGSVSCSRAPQSWYWGWRERWTFTPPPPTIPESDSLTIRPRLPTSLKSLFMILCTYFKPSKGLFMIHHYDVLMKMCTCIVWFRTV